MSEIAETYLVISLLMAVFAAVAAVGTALVLGVGFERLRNGFEIVRKQTAFFSDAIRSLDERTGNLDGRTVALERQTAILDQKAMSLEAHQNELVVEMLKSSEDTKVMRDADVNKASDLIAEVAGITRRMEEQREKIIQKSSMQDNRIFSFSVPYPMMSHVISSHEDEAGQIRLQ